MKRTLLAFVVATSIIAVTSCSHPAKPVQYPSPDDHTKWVSSVMKEIATIKVGMTREQLLQVFTTEGGLSIPPQQTYVYRGCPYIKVDVKFKIVGERDISPAGHRFGTGPGDVIQDISKPYLQWSIMD